MKNFWAITSYFNPASYRRKLANYRVFRENLAVPLLTVELAQSGHFELTAGDADCLIKRLGGDVMWQKERLLNIAIANLPNECTHVAWLDCDLIFDRRDWVQAAEQELRRAPVCQLYGTVHHLAPDAVSFSPGAAIKQHNSLGYALSSGLKTSVASVTDNVPGVFKRGHAWCARRDLLAACTLYDANIVGGGDRMVAHAVTNQVEELIVNDEMTPAHADHYRQWADRFRSAVDRIGFVDGDIFHLWHGDLRYRRYRDRLRILSAANYDPAADIALDTDGCWSWNSPKPDMHQSIRAYFAQRQEDG